jgi:hypothetical protein
MSKKKAANPPADLANAHGDLREAGKAVREARALLMAVSSRHDRVAGHLNRAWREQESVGSDYRTLLAGVLRVLDDCAQLESRYEDAAVIGNGLRALLREQRVEAMPVSAGDLFDGASHESQGEVPDLAGRDPVVAEVVAQGYVRRAGGAKVTVRPALVRIATELGGEDAER